jgi:primosomal protein N' (replication factor Y)
MFAEIAVPLHTRRTFTYRLPPDVAARAQIGCRVVVTFGKKPITGFIVALHDDLRGQVLESSIKDVGELIDETPIITPEILELTRWMSDYYFAPWGECIRAALPAGAAASSRQVLSITDAGRAALIGETLERDVREHKTQVLEILSGSGSVSARELERRLAAQGVKARTVSSLIRRLDQAGWIEVTHRLGDSKFRPKLQNAVRLAAVPPAPPAGPETEEAGNGRKRQRGRKRGTETKRLTEQQQRVIDFLARGAAPVPLGELLDATGVSGSVVRTLESRGVVEVFTREVRRDPLAHVPASRRAAITLTAEQQAALDQIVAKIDARQYTTFLLHGVTGSGKTEVYIQAMHEAADRRRSALMLVPEIALTPMFSRRLRAEFGEPVAILHSSLSDGERIDEWRRIKGGEVRVVIGTRMAVFAPLENLGLVIVDEEHDASYKQDESPRYSGRDTAIVRAANAGAVVVLGSATPSIESFQNARSGKYQYLKLEKRYGERALAEVETVDMREVFRRHGKQQTLSDELKAALSETLGRGEQALVLLNRRGFSSFLLCRSCGSAIHCPNCDVTLTYHRFESSLQCHYCNYIRPVPQTCPVCDGSYIHYVGEGTEQLESRLQAMFPGKRVARLDRDTTRKRGAFEHTLMEFAAGSIDLLVGTQMIAKGHDFPRVTLVGVVSVDVGLSLPDFRSAERTFQLLTQVAGRAGRGDRPGKVIVQSYHPEHYSIVAARSQDYDAFYRREITFRRNLHYPPFTALVNLLIHDKDRERAALAAAETARLLREASPDKHVRVLGPAPAPLARLRGEYRFQVLIKTTNRKSAREALDHAMDRLAEVSVSPRMVQVEVDPVNLM